MTLGKFTAFVLSATVLADTQYIWDEAVAIVVSGVVLGILAAGIQILRQQDKLLTKNEAQDEVLRRIHDRLDAIERNTTHSGN